MQEQRDQSGYTRGSGAPHDGPREQVLPQLTDTERSTERTGWSPTAWRTAREQQR